MATPMFIFMFGFMIEYVYVPKLKILGKSATNRKLHARAFQCYIGFALTSIAALIGGHIDFSIFIKSLFMLEATRYSNILLLYVLYLLLLPWILWIRVRFGIICFPLMIPIIYGLNYFATAFKDIDLNAFNYISNKLIGISMATGGPSALSGLIFLFSGMLIAASITQSKASKLSPFYMYSSILIIINFSFIIVFNDLSSIRLIKDYLTHYAYGPFRGLNDHNYFLLGTLLSCITLTLICLLAEEIIKLKRLPSITTSVGRASLFSFAYGNILLNLFASPMKSIDPSISIILFFTIVILSARFLHLLPYHSNIKNMLYFNSLPTSR